MEPRQIEYKGSFIKVEDCPQDQKPEFAFIGRSNVGKSSLINLICGRKNLAYVSKQPGKTQLINFFQVDDIWYLVDLPGYGYAKVSQKTRASWRKMIEYYFKNRKSLQCAFVLIDSNVPPQAIDLEFINQLGSWQVPFVIVYTKTDRLRAGELAKNIEAFQKAMLESWDSLPEQFISSATKKKGKEELIDFIGQILNQTVGK